MNRFLSRGLSRRLGLGVIARSYTQAAGYQFVKHELSNSVLRLTLNRPELHNAFNEVLMAEITRSFKEIPKEAKVVVLTGEGKSFSAGADLNWMKKMVNYTKEENLVDSLAIYDMMMSIKTALVPVIARVNGAALGGGAGIVSCCDISFALDTAVFGFTEVKLGLVPAAISPFVLDRVGRTNATRYFLTGERFKAPEAHRIGLVNDRFATVEELDKAVEGVLAEISGSGPEAVKRCKNLISKVSDMGLHDGQTRQFTCNEIASARVGTEAQQRLKAFLEKSSK